MEAGLQKGEFFMKNNRFLLTVVSIVLSGLNIFSYHLEKRKSMWQGARLPKSAPAVDPAAMAEERDFLQAMGIFAESEILDQQMLVEIKQDGNVAKITEFLQFGADPNAQDRRENSALSLAVMYNKPEIVRLLLQAGAWPDVVVVDVYEWEKAAGFDAECCTNNPEYFDKFWDNFWSDRRSAMNIVHDFKAFLPFKPIEKHFSKEPSPMDYAIKDAEQEDESFENQLERLEAAIGQFQKDYENYWRNKFHNAYKEYLYENPRPLINFLSNEIYERPGLMLMINSWFRPENYFDLGDLSSCCDDSSCCSDLNCSAYYENSEYSALEFLERLMESAKGSMTSEEVAKIQTLIDNENEINREVQAERLKKAQEEAAIAIQSAWNKHKASSNRPEKIQAYKKAVEMQKQPFGTVENYDLDS